MNTSQPKSAIRSIIMQTSEKYLYNVRGHAPTKMSQLNN